MVVYNASRFLARCIRFSKVFHLKHNLTNPVVNVYHWNNRSYRFISTAVGRFADNLQNCSEVPDISKIAAYIKHNSCIADLDVNRILQIDNLGTLPQEQRTLLLHYSGKALYNKTVDFRQALCDKIWAQLPVQNRSITDYNTYLQICIENEAEINHEHFISSMTVEPDEQTVKLLLEHACTKGHVKSAVEILTMMKDRQYVIDEQIFNLLVLGHTIESGLKGGREVLATMRTAHIPETSNTYWSLLRGLSLRQDKDEFLEVLENSSLMFVSHHFFHLLLALGISNNHGWLSQIKKKFGIESLPRNLHASLEQVCINLLYRGKSQVAIEMYCDLVESGMERGYARFFFKELLSANADTKNIVYVIEYLIKLDKNPLALEDATEIALRNSNVSVSWALLRAFETLRPHYFWPLLLHASKEEGEVGIINTMKNMMSMNVTIDTDTLELYCLPYCDTSNPKQLLIRLEHLGLTIRQILSPILVMLLKNRHIKPAKDLCDNYKLIVQGPRLIRSLAWAWNETNDIACTVCLLRKIRESETDSSDVLGTFLLHALKLCKSDVDYQNFLKLAKILNEEKMRISISSAEHIAQVLNGRDRCTIRTPIQDAIDDLLDISMQQDASSIKHPRHMNLEELECHLVELSGKNMETRGVLRILIQEHSRLGNHKRVQELEDSFLGKGYEQSAGMRSKLLHTHVQQEELQPAIDVYNELRTKHQSFKIDDYKAIDLAALMVKRDQFGAALNLLTEHSQRQTVHGGTHIDKNCRRLLAAARNPDQALKLLDVLKEGGYCTVKNVLLGPLVRSYLKCDDLEGAVAFYKDCIKLYKCTPLQLELICALVEAKNELLLQEVLKATSAVHGKTNTTLTLIEALAEKGLTKPLRKLLSQTEFVPRSRLKARCERWIHEGKLEALETLSDAAHRLPLETLDTNIVYMSIMRTHSSRNDCDGALKFYRNLQEKEVTITNELDAELNNLFKRCKYAAPKDLSVSGIS